MGTPFTARESRRRRRFAPSARSVSDLTLFTALTRREASRSHLGNQRFRPIQPLRHLSLATVVGRKSEIFVMTRICDSRTTERRGRPMARPVSVRAPTVDGRPMQFRTLCKEIPRLCRDAEPATPLWGAHVPSTNRSTPMRRNLASVGVGTGPTPSAGKPRRRRAAPDCLRDLRSRSVHAGEDVIFREVLLHGDIRLHYP